MAVYGTFCSCIQPPRTTCHYRSLQSPLSLLLPFRHHHSFLPPPLLAASAWSDMEVSGCDSDGREFKNVEDMWRENAGDTQKKTQWYQEGVAYWEGVEASVDGVLGGYGHVNDADVKGSEAFLQALFYELFVDGGINRHLVALDCGSGIGRVTKNLLIRYFNEVDLLEPVSHFLEAAREGLVHGNLMASEKRKATNFFCVPLQVDLLEPVSHFLEAAREGLVHGNLMASEKRKATNFFCVPLQEFTPDPGRYDVIWVQWCIGHLTDDDFVSFFKRAKIGLKPGGFFVLKENIAKNGFVLDSGDRSVTRSDSYFKELFNRCGLRLYKSKDQRGLPKELFSVKMYALTTSVPKRTVKVTSKVQANRPGIIR